MSPKSHTKTQSGFLLSGINANPVPFHSEHAKSHILHSTVESSNSNPYAPCISIGGGTRRYCTAHGDVPSCFSPTAQAASRVGTTRRTIESDKNTQDPQKNSQDRKKAAPDLIGAEAAADQHASVSDLALGATTTTTTISPLTIIHKNARSLCKDDSIAELLAELDDTTWDIIALNETWRTERSELWTTDGGHVFAGSGNDEPTLGVAFLINSQWARGIKGFNPISPRLATLDIDISTWRLRIFSAYFPHCGYADAHVQHIYDTLTTVLSETATQHRHAILTGDFNAQVGPRDIDERSSTTGTFALHPSNSRGQWLKSWAGTQHLIITNTHFQHNIDNITTYTTTTNQPRQLDYILVPKTLWRHVHNARSTSCPDLGSDHKAVLLHLHLPPSRQDNRRHRRRQRRHTHTTWPPDNRQTYHEHLTTNLARIPATGSVDDQQQQIITAITDSAAASSTTQQRSNSTTTADADKSLLDRLLHERRQLPNNSSARTTISKRIKKEIRRLNTLRRQQRIETILETYRCLNHISSIKSSRHKSLIAEMTTTTGRKVNDRQEIANVFADFYENLYARRQDTTNTTTYAPSQRRSNANSTAQPIPPFTCDELDRALRHLRNGKSCDTTGIIAEMIKQGNDALHQHLLQLYNDILKPDAIPPQQWRHTTITIIYKSGDPTMPQNYRPIAIIPLLYKLFARLLYNRLETLLDKQQTPDQAGFRHNFSTEDHLYTLTVLHEQAAEWQLNLWVAAIDFKKAFDSINHDKLWQALNEQHVPTAYITLLQSLYAQQNATVKTDQHSRRFNIERGVKQGDPLSSLLFNALLEHLFKRLKLHWTTDRFGMQLGYSATTRLTNLRFADDVLLIGRTRAAITRMLTATYDLAREYGLELHPDKTCILHNNAKCNSRTDRTPVSICGNKVKVLPFSDTTKYLGRLFTFDNYHTIEIHNRISCGWRKFHALRDELTNKRYSLKSRLRLFNGTITPTVLYACTSWTMTTDLATTLQRAQRRMIRLIIGTPRRISQPQSDDTQQLGDTNSSDDHLERWDLFLQRTTRIAETAMSRHHIAQWHTIYLRRKWRWAQRLAILPNNSWCTLITNWRPDTTEQRPCYRRPGRPRKRWRDSIDDFFAQLSPDNYYSTTSWAAATNHDLWRFHEEKFIETSIS